MLIPRCAGRGVEALARWRERILDNAGLAEGETLLDVGCGEGLIGFGALERGAGTVVFSDISQDLLDFCHELVTNLGVLDRCRFLRASAHDLSAVETASVDVVTTRSVLIYVGDKRSAFGEFARVLRPRGRISLFEPINRFARTTADTWAGYDLSPLPEICEKIRAVYDSIQPPESDPMLDFDERDLIAFAEEAGFHPFTCSSRPRFARQSRWHGRHSSAGRGIPGFRPLLERWTKRSTSTNARSSRATSAHSSSRVAARGEWPASSCTRSSPEAGGTLSRRGEVAQLVEHTAENRGVAGSSPALATR
ncbi:hypothetical protein BH18ACT13_BH18ACT13_07150 [soil metagenome]